MYSYFGTENSSPRKSFLSNLKWRRAEKHFGNDTVNIQPIVDAIVNAPSSFGLQPYRVIAVNNKELKEKLREVSFNQPQVTECSTLFIFCARKDIEERAEEYLKAFGGDRGMLFGFLAGITDKVSWAARQAYIALGFGLAACAEEMIYSCPMEGFIPSEVARILELPDNLVPCVYLAVGSEPKRYGSFKKFRFPETDLIEKR